MLKGKAYTLAEDTLVNTDTIPAGYLVVKAQWLRLDEQEREKFEETLRGLNACCAQTVFMTCKNLDDMAPDRVLECAPATLPDAATAAVASAAVSCNCCCMRKRKA